MFAVKKNETGFTAGLFQVCVKTNNSETCLVVQMEACLPQKAEKPSHTLSTLVITDKAYCVTICCRVIVTLIWLCTSIIKYTKQTGRTQKAAAVMCCTTSDQTSTKCQSLLVSVVCSCSIYKVKSSFHRGILEFTEFSFRKVGVQQLQT